MIYDQMGDSVRLSDVDGPVPEPVNAPVRSLAYKWWEKATAENMTIRQLYTSNTPWGGGYRLVGTAKPTSPTGSRPGPRARAADGFNLTPTHLPHGIDDFVEHVVTPELQRRGMVRAANTKERPCGRTWGLPPYRSRWQQDAETAAE